MKNETENLIIRIVTTIGIYLWHNASVFIIYLVLNVLDTLTCMLKAKNSRQGLKGVLRKLFSFNCFCAYRKKTKLKPSYHVLSRLVCTWCHDFK